ncbi:hypothetical protein Tco_1335056 [Tanacetum coccineum]
MTSAYHKKLATNERVILARVFLPYLSAISEIIIESVKQTVKPLNRQFNAFNKLESARFVVVQKEVTKVLKTKMETSIRMKVRKGMKEVRDKLKYRTMRINQNFSHVQEMTTLMRDMVHLLDSASIFAKANAEGEKWEKANPNLDTTDPNAQI